MVIRRATKVDAEAIANCLLLAMRDIIYFFIGERDPAKAFEFMIHFVQGENNQYSYTNCWVASVDEQVVGAANVYDGADLHTLRQPVIDYVALHFAKAMEVGDETEAGEIYLDTIGVDPTHQGKGIGAAILSFLINEYVVTQHRNLGLLVDAENPAAKKLYTRTGFQLVNKKLLFGKTLEHLQVRPHS